MSERKAVDLLVILIVVLAIIALCVVAYVLLFHVRYDVETHTDYHDPPGRDELRLTDDELADKNPAFDETLVDTRPLGDWEVNKSAAVIELDCPAVKPDTQGALLVLRPSYAGAVNAAAEVGLDLLPSANLLDGAAKQFDDGLYAAIDLACFRGQLGLAPAAPDIIKTVFDRLPQGSPARPFLAAALELGGRKVVLDSAEAAEKRRLLAAFERDRARSKPISFYNWTPELQQVWRFYRFLQREFYLDDELQVPRAVADVLKGDPALLAQYRAINGFYGRLTNPMISLPVDVLIGTTESLAQLAQKHGARRQAVAIVPPSTSRETELFDRLFPMGVPANVNLMSELIRRIRSGEVDLAPGENDGWYQHQVHALETMLLPSKGQEEDKLLLTAKYKKRLVEAFKALITKRRETHARQVTSAGLETAAPFGEGHVRPRLRIEPCATFYLRTARAYAFLQNFLLATAGEERLAELRGLKKGGDRAVSLAQELDAVRRRFYGFYLLACEDIGMRPQFLEDEAVDQTAAMKAALSWLKGITNDPDLACDTRVSVPIYIDPTRGTRLWATLGVRLAHLEASYARPPRVRPREGGAWEEVEAYQLDTSRYVIPVDEFAEFEIPGSNALTRDELRAICDQHKTKEEILSALTR